MTKAVFVCASIALAAAVAPALAGGQPRNGTHVVQNTAPRPTSGAKDCEARIAQLDASNAEGEERLAEKDEVIAVCARQYERDRTIGRLVQACAKFEEQPVVKQQFVADCQLAAFNYANALRMLKAEYKK